MELYSEADKTIWEEKYMPVSLKKGQKVSLTKGNPGLKNVVVGIGWDINAFDTGGDFDLDAAAFCLTDSGRVSDSHKGIGNLSEILASCLCIIDGNCKCNLCDIGRNL